MPQASEQIRADLAALIRGVEVVSKVFPGKIDAELVTALRHAAEQPLLLDLLAQALKAAK